jgi:rRNA maturation protein Nop10
MEIEVGENTMKVKICPECGTALGIEEGISVKYECEQRRIWKDCSYCEGRGWKQEIQDYGTTACPQILSFTCPMCGGNGKEPTDMVIM